VANKRGLQQQKINLDIMDHGFRNYVDVPDKVYLIVREKVAVDCCRYLRDLLATN
jgi:ABC-type lipopolysaccharide export system ATPase subunit